MDVYQASLSRFEDVYSNVMSLYIALKSNPKRSVRRADMKQGEVVADPTDFICDVEIKARRVLNPVYYEMFLRLAANEQPELLPAEMRQDLGQAFLKSKLSESGHYRTLFFRVKNQQMHDHIDKNTRQFPEEVVNPEDLLNE